MEADLSNRDILKGRAEAVLFALGRAVTLNELNIALETDVKEVKKVLSELMDEYENDSRGLVIKCINDTYLLTTKAEYSNSIAKIINTPDKFKFTDAVLEILSVIAYKQPVTRSEIEEIRGVGCGNNLNRLIDYELIEEKGRLDNLTIGFCGDLKNGRTDHSLIKAMVCFPNNKFILVSTSELALPVYVKDILEAAGMEYKEVTDLEEVVGELDVLYMTRIQKERFASEEEYQTQSGNYILDTRKLSMGKPDLIVLHPLPRVNEIAIEVDDDPRAMYFKQAKYGMYIRMALILTVINGDGASQPLMKGRVHKHIDCSNPNCITHHEKYLPHWFKGDGTTLVCEYCDERTLVE